MVGLPAMLVFAEPARHAIARHHDDDFLPDAKWKASWSFRHRRRIATEQAALAFWQVIVVSWPALEFLRWGVLKENHRIVYHYKNKMHHKLSCNCHLPTPINGVFRSG
jgi:hypothetical protein